MQSCIIHLEGIYMSSEKKKTHRRWRWAKGDCFVKFSWVKNSARKTIERVHKIPNPPIYGTAVNMEPFFFYLQAFALLHLLCYTLHNLLGYTPVCQWRISDTIYISSEKKTHRRLRWAKGDCFVKFSWVKNSARKTIESVHKIPNPPIYGTTVNMEPFFPTCKHFTYFISYATLYTISRVTLLGASEGFRTPLVYLQRRSIKPSQLKAAA